MKKLILSVRLFREVVVTSVAIIKLVQLIHDFVIPALNYKKASLEKLFKQNPVGQWEVRLRAIT